MSDDFLSRLHEEPRPEFARALKDRLDAIEAADESPARVVSVWQRWRPALAGASLVALVVVTLTVPAVRVAARGFLELFRVRRFAAVPVDTERLAKLEQQQQLDLKALVAEQVEVLEAPGEPQVVTDMTEAASLAGVEALEPRTLPRHATLAEIRVSGRGALRATVDTEKLAALAGTLGVTELDVPEGLDGAVVSVRTSPAIFTLYKRGQEEFRLAQARSPEITLPEGLDLPRLGALGLQLAGLSAEEARLFAGTIDWRSTVLVPVPIQGGTYRDVELRAGRGLLVTVKAPRRAEGGGHTSRWFSILLWSSGERVFALQGPGHGMELIEMANSIG